MFFYRSSSKETRLAVNNFHQYSIIKASDISHESSVMSHESWVIDDQSSVTSHRDISHPSSVISHTSPAIKKKKNISGDRSWRARQGPFWPKYTSFSVKGRSPKGSNRGLLKQHISQLPGIGHQPSNNRLTGHRSSVISQQLSVINHPSSVPRHSSSVML